jgi:tyrosine-protein phosphatase SIW14
MLRRSARALVAFACFAVSFPVWAAEPVANGVPNFHQVNDRIYRGAQPGAKGWNSLAKLGIKTVIDLRGHSTKEEQHAVESAGMRYINVPLGGLSAPPAEKISKLLALLNDSQGAVFVHCRRGADRTGTLIACYRIAHDGWSNAKALQEAFADGMAGFEIGMQRYVLAFHTPVMTPVAGVVVPPAPPAAQAQSSTLN